MTKIALLVVSAWFVQGSAFAKPARTLPVNEKFNPIAEAKKDVLLDMEGKIYPKDTFPTECSGLFKGVKCPVASFGRFHVESKREGDLIRSTSTFTGPEGVQVLEDSWEKDGHIIKAKIENRALGKTSELEVRDGKVFYKLTDKNGKVSTSDDDAEENLVVPSTLMSYVRPKFADLIAGKEVKIRMAVLDRQEAYTFIMKKYKEEKSASGEDILVLQLAPWSFIVKAAVDPLYFFLNPKTGEMFAFEGRSALRRKVGEKYKEMEVFVAYDYKVNTFNLLKKATAQNDAIQTTNCSSGTVLGTGKDAKCEVKSQ